MKNEGERFQGLQGIDLTTSGHFFMPELTFQLANEINKELPREDWMQIEIYATQGPAMPFISAFTETMRFEAPIPGEVTLDKIHAWQKEYPNTKVGRVHLPFNYDLSDAWRSMKDPHFTNRNKLFQVAWTLCFGNAENMKGVHLAEALEVGINAHVNVIADFGHNDRLQSLTENENVPYVLVETGQYGNSPYVSDTDTFMLPSSAIRNLVEKYALDGILIGVEHSLEADIDLEGELEDPKVQTYTQAMHLAGEDHTIHFAGSEKLKRFLQKVGLTKFAHPVRGTLDLNPFMVRKLSGQQQIDLIKDSIAWINSTQGR